MTMEIFKRGKKLTLRQEIFFKSQRGTFHNDERVNTSGRYHMPITLRHQNT